MRLEFALQRLISDIIANLLRQTANRRVVLATALIETLSDCQSTRYTLVIVHNAG